MVNRLTVVMECSSITSSSFLNGDRKHSEIFFYKHKFFFFIIVYLLNEEIIQLF